MNLKQVFFNVILICLSQGLFAQNDTILIGTQIWLKNNLDTQAKGAANYDFNAQKYHNYGKLYTWKAAMEACPTGWHLPTKEEFKVLLKTAKKSAKNTFLFLTDTTIFNANLSGFILSGSSRNLGVEGNYWTSTEMKSGGGAYVIRLNKQTKKVKLMIAQENFQYSVRCIKD